MCIDSLIAINSLSLATFPLFVALPYTGKAAKLKLFDVGNLDHETIGMDLLHCLCGSY